MDRRSWLWRMKSIENSPGETESSGSLSSYSERFFDDQVYPAECTPSPEVTSKTAPDEDVTDVKTLTEKLSAALLDIRTKEELIKENAKLAEEAVSGWEKAENEVLTLKQQLDAAKQKNSVLEDQVAHLDEALEECMKQLWQAKEKKEQNINESVANNPYGWDSEKSELEGKVKDLEAQLETAKAYAAASIRSDLYYRLEDVEKENSILKSELQSRLEELEFRIIERDLSNQAAEAASKQHLESVNKVAKLEAECRKLKNIARKTLSSNDHKSLTASSVCVESFTDSLSDSGERLQTFDSDMRKLGGWDMNEHERRHSDSWALITELDQFKNENSNGKKSKNHMVPSTEINLMDDFLEMERLAALPDTENGGSFLVVGSASDQPNVGQEKMKAEAETMAQKNTELEKKLHKMEADKLEVELVLIKCQEQLEASENRIKEAELKVEELQRELALARKSNQEVYEELKPIQAKNEITESKFIAAQTEVEELTLKICSLEEEIEKERALSSENLVMCRKLEDELMRMKDEAQHQQDAEILYREGVNTNSEQKLKQEKELALAATRFAECRKTIESLALQLKSLATLEDFTLDSENSMESTCEVKQGPQNGEQLKLHNSELSLLQRDSESSLSLNKSIAYEKMHSSFGRFHPRSKSVSRTRNHL
ncbi:hypothetical protein TanjilG_26711 [Lupinus angustifolius]|uniref:Filament-like plant protein n=1 Tax=Lupinus angustifolius TaxID=3871 RepID=A0A394DLL2_LUPAN|nr:PREDICTED: filament-like plant protein isoform X1 [Lupinus angustifolius]OIW20977.1 hypothetical protein TanjilG_26711 [Lupinus angustifolius]